jgi:hypothetical protein
VSGKTILKSNGWPADVERRVVQAAEGNGTKSVAIKRDGSGDTPMAIHNEPALTE